MSKRKMDLLWMGGAYVSLLSLAIIMLASWAYGWSPVESFVGAVTILSVVASIFIGGFLLALLTGKVFE